MAVFMEIRCKFIVGHADKIAVDQPADAAMGYDQRVLVEAALFQLIQ